MTTTRSAPLPPVEAVPAPFFNTRVQRIELGRQRFFDEGQSPAGLVGALVAQSWSRCLRAKRRPDETPTFDPVGRSRISSTLARNETLLRAARPALEQLERTLAGTACKVLLTDADGVVVYATPVVPEDGDVLRCSARVGVDLGERSMGTTAPAIVASTGYPCIVEGPEHFFARIAAMHCAAAPIRDGEGRLVGVLDVSSESHPFRFDAAAVTGLHAAIVENRLLQAQAGGHLLLQFQLTPALLDTPLEGLAAIDEHGRVAWVNGAGGSLLRGPAEEAFAADVEACFGLRLGDVLALTGQSSPFACRLPNGLTLWLRARLQGGHALALPSTSAAPRAADHAGAEPPSAPARADLRSANRQWIESALAAAGGNVSRAARALGVSRGLLYRRLQGWREADDAAAD